jgi:hypothetical protein
MPAELLQENLTNAYISYQSLLPERPSQASSCDTYYYISLEKILSLNPRTFAFTVTSTVTGFKDIHCNFTHSFCANINSSWGPSSSSGSLQIKYVLILKRYHTVAN